MRYSAQPSPKARDGLSRLLLYDQHFVGSAGHLHGVFEQGYETFGPVFPAVEAEDEFIEIGLDMFFPQAVIDTGRPAFEVREDAMNPRQNDMGGHRSDGLRLMGLAFKAGIAWPAIGLDTRSGGDGPFNKAVKACLAEILDSVQPDAA